MNRRDDGRLDPARIGVGAAGTVLTSDGMVGRWQPAPAPSSCVAAYAVSANWAPPPSMTPLSFGTPIMDVGGDITLSGGGWTINTNGWYVVSIEMGWSVAASNVKGRATVKMDVSTLSAGNLFYDGNAARLSTLVDASAVFGAAGYNPLVSHTSVPVEFQAGDAFSFEAQCALATGSYLNFSGDALVTILRVA